MSNNQTECHTGGHATAPMAQLSVYLWVREDMSLGLMVAWGCPDCFRSALRVNVWGLLS